MTRIIMATLIALVMVTTVSVYMILSTFVPSKHITTEIIHEVVRDDETGYEERVSMKHSGWSIGTGVGIGYSTSTTCNIPYVRPNPSAEEVEEEIGI